MFYLDFWYFFFVFFLCHKTVYEKCTTGRNVSRSIYFENSVVHSCISLTRQKPLMGCYDKFCAIKWFDFCLGRTLRVIFKWLVNGGRWIIIGYLISK